MLVVVKARPAEAAFPGKNGKIAYAADDGGIYTINPNGGATFRVTHTNTFAATPNYSPNGKSIAYSNTGRFFNDTATTEIYTINATGANPSKSPTTIRT